MGVRPCDISRQLLVSHGTADEIFAPTNWSVLMISFRRMCVQNFDEILRDRQHSVSRKCEKSLISFPPRYTTFCRYRPGSVGGSKTKVCYYASIQKEIQFSYFRTAVGMTSIKVLGKIDLKGVLKRKLKKSFEESLFRRFFYKFKKFKNFLNLKKIQRH